MRGARALADRVKFLKKQFALDLGEYGGLRGKTALVEAAVHELAHAAVLGLSLRGRWELTKDVADAIRGKGRKTVLDPIANIPITNVGGERARDWQEILALACEFVVLRRLGIHVATGVIVRNAASNMEFYTLSAAARLVRRSMRTNMTTSRSKKVLDAILGAGF